MRVTIVPCLSDNYAYLLAAKGSHEAVVVDPGEWNPVERACTEARLKLVAILNTHHHWDHVGGNDALLRQHAKLRVFGHPLDQERIPGFTDPVEDGDVVAIGGLTLTALHVPGHTRGAVTYVGHGHAFTGDTLFAAGCGRLFEGTAEQLFESLNRKLASLPEDTAVFCGHEYTVKNLDFAASVEPSNQRIQERREQALALRADGRPTLPTTIEQERETNPFLRTQSREIRERLAPAVQPDAPDVEVFAALRAARNHF